MSGARRLSPPLTDLVAELRERTAAARLSGDTAILGLTTNLGFVSRLAGPDAFRDASIATAWLDRTPDAFPAQPSHLSLVLASWAPATGGAVESSPSGIRDGYRLDGPPAPVVLELDSGGERSVAHVEVAGGHVRAGEPLWSVHPVAAPTGQVRLEVDRVVEPSEVEVTSRGVTVGHQGDAVSFLVHDAVVPAGGAAEVSDGVLAGSMPGVVLAVNVAVGETVAAGTVLGVMEATKMELALSAPHDGVVVSVDAAVGDRLALGQALFEVEAPS